MKTAPSAVITGARLRPTNANLGDYIRSALWGNWEVVPFDILDGRDALQPEQFGPPPDDLGLVVNCAGINRAAWLMDVTDKDWDDVMNANARSILKMSQWALPALKKNGGAIVNIISNASHMPMTTSMAYNASKAAAHIMTQQLARELRGTGVTVFGISPNKLRGTGMSRDIEAQVLRLRGWTPEYAKQYQLNALPAGEETDPKELADFLAYLLSNKSRHKYLHGCILPYGA